MYRGLIDYLAFVYGFVCRGRAKIGQEDMGRIVNGAHAVTANAPAVLGGLDDGTATEEDRKDLQEALKIDRHIDDMYAFLKSMEIC